MKKGEKLPMWMPTRGGHPWNEDTDMPISYGRPSLYNEDRGRVVIAALMKGLVIKEAAMTAGVAMTTLYNWRRENEAFNVAMAAALSPGGKPRKTRTIKRARGDEFDNHIANIILDELARGRTMKDICKAIDMPSRQTVTNWAKKRPDFKARIEKCRTKLSRKS